MSYVFLNLSIMRKGFMFRISFFFCFYFIANNIIAQSTNTTYDTNAVAFNKAYFKSYLTDTRDILIGPLHWNTKQAGACAGVIIAAAALSLDDVHIRDFSQRNRTNLTNNISTYGVEPWGNGQYTIGTMALLYLGGTIFKDDRSKKVAMLGAKTYILTGGAVEIPKFLLERDRPYQDPTYQYLFKGPVIPVRYTSLPSGHTTSAFAMATIVASEYKEKPLVVILSYTIATLGGMARIHDNQHWASDVLCGAAFGYAMGKLIYNKNNWGVKQFKAP
jgi:membrane-associated phospholipid phosphatase